MDDPTTPPSDSRHRTGRRWVPAPGLAGLAGLAGVLVVGVLVTGGPFGQDPQASTTTVAPSTTGPSTAEPSTDPARRTPATIAVTPPASLAIPSIGVTSDLVRLGLEPDRTVEVPEDADLAGWYELGTSPGQRGSAVILGHVDSATGPAVFHRLRELTPGDRVQVTLDDGAVETFRVSALESVPNERFPAQGVYAGTPDRPTLVLVTCGGEYDADAGGYQSNVIVYAEHVGRSSPPVS